MRLIPKAKIGSTSSIRKCPRCGNWYKTNTHNPHTQCLVNHPPGSCCHYNDTKLEVIEDEETGEKFLRDKNGNTYDINTEEIQQWKYLSTRKQKND